MARIVAWTPEQAKKELARRLHYCKDARKNHEYQWEECERATFNTRAKGFSPNLSVSFQSEVELGITDVDSSNNDIGINYTFKNLRFIHSQLSANPPSVVVRPTSNDPSDRRKADAADRLIRFALRQYKMQELFDQTSLKTLVLGTGFIKTIWDAEKGDIIDMDESTGELTMDGDISVTTPSTWDIYMDPDATTWDEVKFMFERMYMPYDEAMFKFPGMEETLEKVRIKEEAQRHEYGSHTALTEKKYDVVEIYQYWEKGLPYNGMIGRFCYITRDGDLITPVGPNPVRFSPPRDHGVENLTGDGSEVKPLPAKAILPYHIFTDIDLPGTCWGRSIVAFEAPLQDMYNRMMNVTMDNIQAHGVARLILPEGSEIADGSITNSPWDIVKITGNQPPSFMEPMPLPASMPQMLNMAKQGIDDMAGVNEAMFGQTQREQSGFSMQYATNQGNMIRRRLFNKYVLLTENVYKAFLNLVKKHWEENRIIYVLGKEKAFEAVDIKGSDIDGGFDLVVEYGASLSLDPTTRRQEILTMMPLFEKAGISPRTALQLLKLNELEGMYDIVQMAEDRQREIFEEMIAKDIYIKPREMQDHTNMLSYAYNFLMTSEFKYLRPEHQALVEQHIKEREQVKLASAQQPGGGGLVPGAAPGAGGAVNPGGMPAVPGSGGPLDVMQTGPISAVK